MIHLNELIPDPIEMSDCDIEPEARKLSIISSSEKFSDQSAIIPSIGIIK